MRRVLVCLIVLGLSVLFIWGCEDPLGLDNDDAPPKLGRLQEENFRFVERDRRDPFTPLFEGKDGPPSDEFTPRDLLRARHMLASIQENFSRFRTNASPFTENELRKQLKALDLFIRKPCSHAATQIHLAELQRRTQNYYTLIDEIRLLHSGRVLASKLEVWLDEASKLVEANKLDEAEKRLDEIDRTLSYPKVRRVIGTSKKQGIIKTAKAIREKIAPLRFAKGIEGAQQALSLMRRDLQMRRFEAALKDHGTFRRAIETLSAPRNGNERQQIDYMVRRAQDMRRQAQLAIAQKGLAEAGTIIAQAESCLLCDEFDVSIDHSKDALQFLRNMAAPTPEIRQAIDRLIRTASGLARRASIRKEFLRNPPSIAGVGIEPGNSVVLVNGNVLREGDCLDTQTRVKLIANDYVVFTYKKEDIRVSSGL